MRFLGNLFLRKQGNTVKGKEYISDCWVNCPNNLPSANLHSTAGERPEDVRHNYWKTYFQRNSCQTLLYIFNICKHNLCRRLNNRTGKETQGTSKAAVHLSLIITICNTLNQKDTNIAYTQHSNRSLTKWILQWSKGQAAEVLFYIKLHWPCSTCHNRSRRHLSHHLNASTLIITILQNVCSLELAV